MSLRRLKAHLCVHLELQRNYREKATGSPTSPFDDSLIFNDYQVFHNILTTHRCIFAHIERKDFGNLTDGVEGNAFKPDIFADKLFEFLWRNLSQAFKAGGFHHRAFIARPTELFGGGYLFLFRVTVDCFLFISDPEK